MRLTIAETAFLAPAGVILGALVSYFAVRKSAKDNATAQRLTIEANRQMAEADRDDAIERERRQHKRAAYVELIGLLDNLNDTRHDVLTQMEKMLYRAYGDIKDFGLTEEYRQMAAVYTNIWSEAMQLARAYGSVVMVDGIAFLGDYRPRIAAYKVRNRAIHASNVLIKDGRGDLLRKRITVAKYDDDAESINAFYEMCNDSGIILRDATNYCLYQIRRELDIDDGGRYASFDFRVNKTDETLAITGSTPGTGDL